MKKMIFILLLVGFCGPAWAECVTKGTHPAALTEDDYSKAMSCFINKDFEALAKLILSDRATIIEPGLIVFIEDTKTFSGMVKVRPKGATTSIWTSMDVVGCD